MDLAADFVMTPLPAIGGIHRDVAADPLGRLGGLAGTWSGTGFNVIWRPNSSPGQDRFLELNVTKETLQFERVPGQIANRGLLQQDIVMFGLHYLQQISDANLDAGLHFEPGIWAHAPRTTDPHEGVTVIRMASIPHGTTIVAQGNSTTADESTKPTIPVTDIRPFTIGSPAQTIQFPEQTLKTKTSFRTSAPGLVGVTQKMVDDPSSILRAAIAKQNITSTTRLHVTTDHKPVPGGGTANTAFLAGGPDGPNADAFSVNATFWLEKLDNASEATQLQYSQTVILNFNGISWPHITVATLRKTT